MNKKIASALLAIALPASAHAAQCNQKAWTEAKIRCATSPDKGKCYEDVYMAMAGYSGLYECRVGEMNKFTDFLEGGGLDGAIKDAQGMTGSSQPSKSSNPGKGNSPGQFGGVAPFGSSNTAPINQMPTRSFQPGMLPPSVQQMMQQIQGQQLQSISQPYGQTQQNSCQGVTTSKITGFDQNGAAAPASAITSHEILQLVRSQQNNGRKYYLASNGYWYDAGFIKKMKGCSL